MSREIMQQVLNIIKLLRTHDDEQATEKLELISAFEQELAKPEPEPVAWMTNSEHEYSIEYKFNWLQTPLHDIPLYTAPPRKEWVGLSVNEARDFFESKLTRAELIIEISEFLEEKNT